MAPYLFSVFFLSFTAFPLLFAEGIADSATPAALVRMRHLYRRAKKSYRQHVSAGSDNCPEGCHNWRARYGCSPTITSHRLDSGPGRFANCFSLHLVTSTKRKASFCFAEIWLPSTTFQKLRVNRQGDETAQSVGVLVLGQNGKIVGDAPRVVLPSRPSEWLVIDLPSDDLFARKKLDVCVEGHNVALVKGSRALRMRIRTLSSSGSPDAFYVTGYRNTSSLDHLIVTSQFAARRKKRAATLPTSEPPPEFGNRDDSGLQLNVSDVRNNSADFPKATNALCSVTAPVGVTFAQLGMHSVLAPEFLYLRDCRGVCIDTPELERASKFALLKQQIRQIRNTGGKLPEMSASCCVPTAFNSLTVLAARVEPSGDDGSYGKSGKLVHRSFEMLTLEGLIPSACGCS